MANGTYVIPVWDTITYAWEKVSGSKKTFWGAILLFFVIMFGLGFVEGLFKESNSFLATTIKIIANVIGYFMQMGLLYVGIKRAFDLPIEYKQMFRVFEKEIAIKVVLLYILQILVFLPVIAFLIGVSVLPGVFPAITPAIPIILFVVGGIALVYLSVRMLVSNALVLDKAMGAWDSIKLSFKVTRGNFWPCLGLILSQIIIVVISAIPLGIGLIWSLPLVFICYGIIYKRLMVNAT